MLIEVLECRVDGTQELVQREVADNWFDPPVPTVAEQIAALREALDATDYKIVKCYEYQLAGLELPYDVAELHKERQALRDEINALEASGDGEHS